MKVIVVSDVHLGYENSDRESFVSFLESLAEDPALTDLVLLGDIVDMWRRDASGVFFESYALVESMLALAKKKVTIHYIAGNHDYHTLKLQKNTYPFHFDENLSLKNGKYTYTFYHGYEFDPEQQKPIMEALCRVMSDEAGNFESGVWATLTAKMSDFEYFTKAIFQKKVIKQKTDHVQLKPEERLQQTRTALEEKVAKLVKLNEVVVFGHTHVPFVNKTETVVNSGSWVTDSAIHNTYVELADGKPRLFVYNSGEITERVE